MGRMLSIKECTILGSLLLMTCKSEAYPLKDCDDSQLQVAPPTQEAFKSIGMAMSKHQEELDSMSSANQQVEIQELALINRTFFCEAGYSLKRTIEVYIHDQWIEEPKYTPRNQFDSFFLLSSFLVDADTDKALELEIINQVAYDEIKFRKEAEFVEFKP